MLGRVYLPARYAFHVLQITSLYVGQLGPSAAITNASFFQAADELRALQWIAYRAKSLSLTHGPELIDSALTRRKWQQDEAWQPARELLERLLLAYDWGEAFTVLNLVVKPALDTLFKTSFADLAQANGDGLTAQLLRESGVDSVRSQDWAGALVSPRDHRPPGQPAPDRRVGGSVATAGRPRRRSTRRELHRRAHAGAGRRCPERGGRRGCGELSFLLGYA